VGEIADEIIERMIDGAFLHRPAAQRRKPPNCPKCGRKPKVTHTQFGWRRDCCGLWGWGKHAPLVDGATHQARSYAHKVFDSLWQTGLVGRSRAYALLAQELGISPDECHMKLMDRATAERVPAAAHAIGKRLKEG
jgi:ribosomal protein L37AE/L43A